MFSPADLLGRLGGIARGTQLQKFGCSRKAIATAARTGSIIRIRQGTFALPTADAEVVAAATHGGALTCTSALRAHGVWMLPPGENDRGVAHVWMGGAGRQHPHEGCACAVHYSPGRAGLGIAPVAAALIHAYRCLTAETFFAAYESAWNKRLIGAYDRARIRRELPQSAGWLLDLARHDSASGLESLLRLRLHLLGIRLDCQVEIEGVGRVDFVVGGRVILEADGKENHDNPTKRHRDLMRDAAASARGFETLRFDYAMIVHDWPTVVAAILPALARARA
ncbi:endonuclease domain-containing protein [Microbacterium aurantiacum]|uniref:endonuclease domain-containing protein n=1 Tax=Microbacterium aurantiacum TaxID=162393 RepID=UPI000C809C8B|nr:type IV toxin-antitoxin system AbiEi family antitoxin domain-containing protein [Microbacterium aurantiacum]